MIGKRPKSRRKKQFFLRNDKRKFLHVVLDVLREVIEQPSDVRMEESGEDGDLLAALLCYDHRVTRLPEYQRYTGEG